MRVVGELGKVKETYLVVLFDRDVIVEILLEHIVDLFCLTVDLQVKRGGEVECVLSSVNNDVQNHPVK